ncbi:MAG: glucosamine-6-phosphate deaminase, partial [Opitutaceae bacterium]
MRIQIHDNPVSCGVAAAAEAAGVLRSTLAERGRAEIIVATGASQFETLRALTREPGIDWARVRAFHLDEYVGLPETHPASFRRYLRERFLEKLPVRPEFIPVRGDAGDLASELARLAALISGVTIDLCLAGIGENGHLAFNDPPADFETTDPYLVVDLDEACRRQQLGEGWFGRLEEVPRRAVSMSIREVLRARRVIVTAPDLRKAVAIQAAVEGLVTPACPSSALQNH